MSITLGVNGAGGRMGRRIMELAGEDPDLTVAAALERPEHPDLGKTVGEMTPTVPIDVVLATALTEPVDVMIDFSGPAGTEAVLAQCLAAQTPLVTGTTGLSDDQRSALADAAKQIPVLLAPNMSLGVNVLFQLTAEAARMLGTDFDVEIVEKHHRFKKDAPSGTALRLAEKVTEEQPGRVQVHGREGIVGERKPEELGMHALRVGDTVGEHTVVFSTLSETIELVHKAHSRDCFVRGALKAAKFLVDREPGMYDMNSVLGL